MEKLVLRKIIEIAASQTDVWKSLTDCSVLKETMFGCDILTNWKVGSQILFRIKLGEKTFEDKGNITSLDEGVSFSYLYWSNFSGLPDLPENYSEIRFELSGRNNLTTLRLVHSKFATRKMYESSDKNWDNALLLFKEHVES